MKVNLFYDNSMQNCYGDHKQTNIHTKKQTPKDTIICCNVCGKIDQIWRINSLGCKYLWNLKSKSKILDLPSLECTKTNLNMYFMRN